MILRAAGALLLALLPAPVASPPPKDTMEAALMRHIAILADDDMEGRRPGTRGADRAVRYIAGEMQAAGLQPGAADGSWYQAVDLVERRRVFARLKWRGISVDESELALLGREGKVRLGGAPLIFAGYGLPENLKGIEVAGAVVLLLPGKPDKIASAPTIDARRTALARRGAAAMLSLMASGTSWRVVRDQYANGRTLLASDEAPPVFGAISYAGWTGLLKESGRNPQQLESGAGDPGFRAVLLGGTADLRVRTAVRRYRSVNVIGRVPGAEPRGEAVVTMAHWDHLGICRGPGVSDRICNGAVDNASGVAMMIEVARALAGDPRPRRSLYFVATTAEESGLLGARAFVRNPPVPLKRFVAGLNLDTVAIAGRGAPVAIVGRGMTGLDPIVDATARALGRKVDTGLAANAFVARQDGWELMNAGVPTVMAGGAFNDPALLQRFFASRYHGPSDDLAQHIELGGAAEDVALHVALLRLLGDPGRFPEPAR